MSKFVLFVILQYGRGLLPLDSKADVAAINAIKLVGMGSKFGN